jgi:hypothetical protein
MRIETRLTIEQSRATPECSESRADSITLKNFPADIPERAN